MAHGYWQTLTSLQAPGNAIASSAARTSLTLGQTAARFPMPGDTLKQLGDQLLLKASGIITTVVTTPGTLTLDFSLAGTAICSTGAMTLNIVAQTNSPWYLEMLMSVKTLGVTTAATFGFTGYWLSAASILVPLGATGPGPGGQMVPYSGTATGASTTSAGFDSTISNVCDLNSTFSVSTANSITLQQYSLTLMTATGF